MIPGFTLNSPDPSFYDIHRIIVPSEADVGGVDKMLRRLGGRSDTQIDSAPGLFFSKTGEKREDCAVKNRTVR
jgi:hypothetical protein